MRRRTPQDRQSISRQYLGPLLRRLLFALLAFLPEEGTVNPQSDRPRQQPHNQEGERGEQEEKEEEASLEAVVADGAIGLRGVVG